MGSHSLEVQSQITFLYYDDLDAASVFYGDVMGFELVEDQRWAKIYRVSDSAFVGIVAGDRGFRKAQEYNAVLLTLVSDDVNAWYEHLEKAGVTLLSEIQEKMDVDIRCFFFEDPGGYALEVQQFLRADLVEVFHGSRGP